MFLKRGAGEQGPTEASVCSASARPCGALLTWAASHSSFAAVCWRCSAETRGLCGSLPSGRQHGPSNTGGVRKQTLLSPFSLCPCKGLKCTECIWNWEAAAWPSHLFLYSFLHRGSHGGCSICRWLEITAALLLLMQMPRLIHFPWCLHAQWQKHGLTKNNSKVFRSLEAWQV